MCASMLITAGSSLHTLRVESRVPRVAGLYIFRNSACSAAIALLWLKNDEQKRKRLCGCCGSYSAAVLLRYCCGSAVAVLR